MTISFTKLKNSNNIIKVLCLPVQIQILNVWKTTSSIESPFSSRTEDRNWVRSPDEGEKERWKSREEVLFWVTCLYLCSCVFTLETTVEGWGCISIPVTRHLHMDASIPVSDLPLRVTSLECPRRFSEPQ